MEIPNNLYSTFQKFTDLIIANEVADELRANGIEVIIQENKKSSVGNFTATTIDFDAAINIRPEDFDRADKALESYYERMTDNVSDDYYLFQFSEDELLEIVARPYEWGHFDLQLAKKLLAEKGKIITSETLRQNRKDQIDQVAKIEKIPQTKIIFGYIFSIIFPPVGFIIGYSILSNRKILPNGQLFNLHNYDDRKHGKRILSISIVWFIVLIIFRILTLSK